MGEINKKLFGKNSCSNKEMGEHADIFLGIMKDMPEFDRNVLKDQRQILVESIHSLGEKGATELLGKLGVWMVIHGVKSAR